MTLTFDARIQAQERIAIPKEMAKKAGIIPGSLVRVSVETLWTEGRPHEKEQERK